jgi:hypothetical protein
MDFVNDILSDIKGKFFINLLNNDSSGSHIYRTEWEDMEWIEAGMHQGPIPDRVRETIEHLRYLWAKN